MSSRSSRLQGKRILLGAVAITLAQTTQSALAASASWTGNGADSLWATTGNWSASPVPTGSDTATFNGAGNGKTTIDLGTAVTLSRVVFDTSSAASYTIGAGAVGSQTITVGNTGGFILNAGVTADQLVNANVSLGSGRDGSGYTFTNSSPTATITFAGSITSLGTSGTAGGKALAVGGVGNYVFSGVVSNGTASNTNITKSGTGTLTFTGANTYTGGTTVNNGAVLLDFSAAGAPASNILNTTTNSSGLTLGGGTLNLKLSNSATAHSQRFNGTTVSSGMNAFRVTQNGNTGGGTVATLGALTRSNNGTVDFTLPSTGSITTTSTTSSVGTSKILASAASSAAYATHNATDWVTNNAGTLGVLSSYAVDSFAAGGDVDVQTDQSPAQFTVNTLRFNAASKTLTLNSSGNSVVTSGGILVTSAGTGTTITRSGSGALTSGSTAKDIIIHNYGSLALDAPVVDVNGSTAVAFTHAGTGTTTLTAANTNTNGTFVNSGTLKLGTGGAIGAAGLWVRSGATLDIGGNSWTQANGVTNAGTITNSSATTGTLTLTSLANSNTGGTISGPINIVLANGQSGFANSLAGTINTTGTITNNGTGTGSTGISALVGPNVTSITQDSATSTLVLTASTGSNTLSGPIYILAGQLSAEGNAGANNPLGSGTVYLGATSGGNNATLSFNQTGTVANPIVVQSGSTGTLAIRVHNTSGNINHSGSITLNNDLTFTSSTTQNGGNTYSGGITGTGDVAISLLSTAATGTGLTLQTGALNFDGALLNNGTGTRGVSISSAIGANVDSITQDSTTSSLSLSGNNSAFTGPITVKAGTLSLGTTGGSIGGGSSAILLGDTSGSANAAISLNNNLPYNRGVTTQSGSSGNTLSVSYSGNITHSGAITLGHDLVLRPGSIVATVSGAVSGTGDLSLDSTGNSSSSMSLTGGVNMTGNLVNASTGAGSGTMNVNSAIGANVTGVVQNSATAPLNLNADNSNFAGTVNVNAGLLRLSNAKALNNAAVNATVDGTLRLDSTAAQIGGLNGAATGLVYGVAATGSTTLTLAGTSGSYAFAGVISDDNNNVAAKVLSLTKSGASTQTLSGANTYTGATTVSGGTLLVNGSLAVESSVSVGDATLGGSGVVNGPVTLNSGGKISPGNSVDDLTTGAQTWNSGSTYVWELNDATGVAGGGVAPTAGWDLLNINGALTISASEASPVVIDIASLNGTSAGAAANFNAASNYAFLIADASSEITFNPATFSLSTSNFVNTFDGAWSIVRGDASGIGGDSSQLYLQYAAVPEPATLSVLALGAVGLLRRRRAC